MSYKLDFKPNMMLPVKQGTSRYGIIVVISSFFLHCVLLGTIMAHGIYIEHYTRHHTRFREMRFTRTQVSGVGSVALGALNIFGFLSGKLIDRFGYRKVAITGVFFSSLGYLLASFSSELWHLYLTQGLLVGIGGSLGFVSAVSILGQWFDKHRGLAAGLAVSGTGCGGWVFSYLINRLLISYGASQTLKIVSLVVLVTGILAGSLLKPNTNNLNFMDPPLQMSLIKTLRWASRNRKFQLLWWGSAALSLSFMVPAFIIPTEAALLSIGLGQSAMLVGVLNFSNALGRIVLGYLADKFGRINLLIFGVLTSGLLCVSLWPAVSNFITLLMFCVTYGFLSGSYQGLLITVSYDLFSSEKSIAPINGLLVLSIGIPSLVGTPFAVYLMNLAGSLSDVLLPVKIYCGASFIIGSLILMVLLVTCRKQPY